MSENSLSSQGPEENKGSDKLSPIFEETDWNDFSQQNSVLTNGLDLQSQESNFSQGGSESPQSLVHIDGTALPTQESQNDGGWLQQDQQALDLAAARSFLFGILSICLSWIFGVVGMALGILGIFQGKKGLWSSQARKAKTGRLLSIVGVSLSGLVLFSFIIGGSVLAMGKMVNFLSTSSKTTGIPKSFTIPSIPYSQGGSGSDGSSSAAADPQQAMQSWVDEVNMGLASWDNLPQGFSDITADSVNDNMIRVQFTFSDSVDPAAITGAQATIKTQMQPLMQEELQTGQSLGVVNPQIEVDLLNPDGSLLLSLTFDLSSVNQSPKESL